MTLKNQIQHGSELKSRRFSKGTFCMLLTDSFPVGGGRTYPLLKFAYYQGLLPNNYRFSVDGTGTCHDLNAHVAVPRESVELIQSHIRQANLTTAEGNQHDPARVALANILRQKLVLIKASMGSSLEPGHPIDPSTTDVIVSGMDTLQGSELTFTLRAQETLDPKPIDWTRHRQ